MNKKTFRIILLLILSCYYIYTEVIDPSLSYTPSYNIEEIPDYTEYDYVTINNNEPNFDDLSKKAVSFEVYSELDHLGRAGQAYASLGIDLMPTEERESINSVKPSGWHTVKYDIVNGKYLYNRCHLIGFQLAGENANENNLITCTRYMNTEGMLEFENEVAEYIRNTNNHVLYRVTPMYENNNLVAKGVQMEAYSIEDNGEGVKFNVFVYNIQPGINIDYETGYAREKEKNRALPKEIDKLFKGKASGGVRVY